VPGGERAKSQWKIVEDLMITLGNHHMDRHSYVIAIGGGSVLDMVGLSPHWSTAACVSSVFQQLSSLKTTLVSASRTA